MKLLFLTDKMDIGGAETHVFTLISSLAKMGHEITLASSGGSLAKRLSHELSVPHITLPLDRLSPVRLLICYIRLRHLVKRCGFDLVHSHARLPSLLASLALGRTQIPLVTTVHARFSSRGIRRRLSRWGALSIAVSEDLGQYLISQYKIAPENITVIPNGIDLERFAPRPQGIPHPLRIGFLSRLDSDCSLGAHLLCSIAPLLCERLGRIEILIGGGGSEHGRISELAISVNSALGYECIKLLGRVYDTPSFFSSCSLFIGVSRAAIEASSCGVPVILCGNEGYFGKLTSERFEDAILENLCARGYPSPTPEALLADIISFKDIDADAVRLLVKNELDAKAMASATERVYLKASGGNTRRRGNDVLLCGYYGYGNMGDDALLRSSIRRAKQSFRGASVCALTKGGKKDSERFSVKCIRRYSPIGVLIALARCKYFIFGGGTLLQESTSLRSLLYYSLLLRCAKLFGAHCLIWANGIGRVTSPLARACVRGVLGDCDYVGLRDTASLNRTLSLAEGISPVLESDLATDIPPSDERRCRYLLHSIFSTYDIPPFIIAAPRKTDGLCELERALEAAKQNGLRICFVAMHTGEDLAIAKSLSLKFGEPLAESICYADLRGIVRYSRGVYSMRLHALIAARSEGISYTAFGNDEKLKTI